MGETHEKTTFASRLGHNFLTGLFLMLPIGLTLYGPRVRPGLALA